MTPAAPSPCLYICFPRVGFTVAYCRAPLERKPSAGSQLEEGSALSWQAAILPAMGMDVL